MTRFADRTVLVTGALGGIGRAIVDLFAQAGATLILSDRDAAALDARVATLAEAGTKAAAAPADLRDAGAIRAAIEAAVARTGPVDIAVNNAGWDELRPFLETDEPFWDRVIDINYKGCLRVTKAVLPGMVDRG